MAICKETSEEHLQTLHSGKRHNKLL